MRESERRPPGRKPSCGKEEKEEERFKGVKDAKKKQLIHRYS